MSKLSPERLLAERLIGWEARSQKLTEVKRFAASVVCEKLRPILATLMGNGGFEALLLRALALAAKAIPALAAAKLNSEGALEFDPSSAQMNPGDLKEANIVLIAQLLRLLNSFIGEELTVRLVREAWPKLVFTDPKL